MALLFMDGFDHYATADGTEKWYMFSAVATASGGRTNGYAATAQGLGVNLALGTGPTVIVGAAFKTGSYFEITVVDGIADSIRNGGQCSIYFAVDGSINLYRRQSASGTFIVGTATNIWKANVWNYVEVKLFLDQSVGTAEVRLNGAVVAAWTGRDTCFQATTNATAVVITGPSTNNVDDVYICDGTGAVNNDFLGECRIVTLLPQTDAVAAGSNADFTCSSSTDHGALVDEAAPDDDTSYLSSSTLNHVDSWEYPALGYTGTIKGVQMSLSAKKTDSGTRAIAAVTRPVSTNRVHTTNHYLGTSYIYWTSIWETNPEDSGAWEVADIDAAEFGVKVTV